MTNKNHQKKEGMAKFICDYLPIIIFFIAFKVPRESKIAMGFEPIVFATICLIIITIISLIVSYLLIKKISKVALFSAVVISVFGGLTVLLKDEYFIKIKPTIINLIFSTILLFGYFKKKPMLAILFENKIELENWVWLELSKRWGLFFIMLAIINEIIWRNFSTDFWVNFKVFGMMTLTIIFTISQMPLMLKNIKNKS